MNYVTKPLMGEYEMSDTQAKLFDGIIQKQYEYSRKAFESVEHSSLFVGAIVKAVGLSFAYLVYSDKVEVLPVSPYLEVHRMPPVKIKIPDTENHEHFFQDLSYLVEGAIHQLLLDVFIKCDQFSIPNTNFVSAAIVDEDLYISLAAPQRYTEAHENIVLPFEKSKLFDEQCCLSRRYCQSDAQQNYRNLLDDFGKDLARKLIVRQLKSAIKDIEKGGYPDVFGCAVQSPVDPEDTFMYNTAVTLSWPWPG